MVSEEIKKISEVGFLVVALVLSLVPLTHTVPNPTYTQIGTNQLSLGLQIAEDEQFSGTYALEYQQLVKDAGFTLIRVFDDRRYFQPFSNWATRAVSWASVDSFIQTIFDIGAEPLICFGMANIMEFTPGMSINPATSLPYPDDWGDYCAEWVKHFKQTGKPVRYYEIINEPWFYYGWNDPTKMSNMIALYNSARAKMKAQNPNVQVGFMIDNRANVIDYWLGAGNGPDMDFMSYHSYASGGSVTQSDEYAFNRAETKKIAESGFYSPAELQQLYYGARGKIIPILHTEGNFNSYWETGTDPRCTQMQGAIWWALTVRVGVLHGLKAVTFFRLAISKSWSSQKPTGGWGFCLVNKDNREPYYPYYAARMVGSLAVGDPIIATPSTTNIRTLGWVHENNLNVLLIHRAKGSSSIDVSNVVTGEVNYRKIDESIPYTNPSEQTGTINVTNGVTLTDYTVMLLQAELTEPPPNGNEPEPRLNASTIVVLGIATTVSFVLYIKTRKWD